MLISGSQAFSDFKHPIKVSSLAIGNFVETAMAVGSIFVSIYSNIIIRLGIHMWNSVKCGNLFLHWNKGKNVLSVLFNPFPTTYKNIWPELNKNVTAKKVQKVHGYLERWKFLCTAEFNMQNLSCSWLFTLAYLRKWSI